jgi:hypothetical protein
MRALDISLTDKNTPSFIHARANEDKIWTSGQICQYGDRINELIR